MYGLAVLSAEAAGVVIGVGVLTLGVVVGVRALSRRHKAQQARGKYRPGKPEFIKAAMR